MGYLNNSGSGFLSNAVTTVSNVKSYLVNKTGYLVDSIRVGIGDFGQRVLDDGGTIEASAEAAASYREITKDIYDQASLVLFPSGYKDNLLYSHKPVNGSGDFTYTRGTDTATRVGADGYIKKERANLLEQSNQFDTTWTRNGITPTSGQSGYDGSNNAWLIEKTLTNAYRSIVQDVSISGVQTFSLYCKGGTLDIMTIYIAGSANAFAEFDVSTGNPTSGTIISQSFAAINPKIENFGNGWYRLSVNCNSTTNQVRIYPDWDLNNLGTIYIQDAQLEEGLVATPYIETTTAPVYEGLTDNLPRIDYTGGTPSILLEPSRTNDFSFSEYASGNTLMGSPIITENYAISPDGLSNAFRIQDTTGSTFKRIAEGFSVSANSTYTQSIFVKKATSAVSTYGGVGFDYSGGTRQISYIIFDEYNGTMTAIQSQSTLTLHDTEDYGDYWRFSITAKDTGSNSYLSMNIYACLSANGTSPTTGIKDWIGYGLQLEQGSYPTSYIPTYGSSATRAADTFNTLTYADNFNSLTFYAEVEMKDVLRYDATPIIRFGDTSSNNGSIRIFRNSDTNSKRAVILARTLSGSNIINYTSTEDKVKIKLTYDNSTGDWELFINGESEATGTSLDFNEFDTLEISGVGGQARIYKMYIKNSI